MRIALFIYFLSLSILLPAQRFKKPIEGSMGLAIYQNLNTRVYNEASILEFTNYKLSQDGMNKIYWNLRPAIIREYHFGGAVLLRQTPDFRREWLINIDLAGQFQQHYIVNSNNEMLVEEQIIDSNSSESTFEKRVISVVNFNDVVTLRPSISWKHHLNRRFNVRSDLRFSLGVPVKNGFEVNKLETSLIRTYYKGSAIDEYQTNNREFDPPKFIGSDFYLAFGASVGLGIEFRVIEKRAIFISASGIVGRQMQLLSSDRNKFRYAGGEIRIISRF
jgi:hypothetical protein